MVLALALALALALNMVLALALALNMLPPLAQNALWHAFPGHVPRYPWPCAQ